jgi:hypothetical protein
MRHRFSSIGSCFNPRISLVLAKMSILLLILAIITLSIAGCNCTDTDSLYLLPEDYIGVEGTDLLLSPVPKLGETAELTFIHGAQYNGSEKGLNKCRAWVECYYANTIGSYSEAKYAVPVPLEEVLVSGELTWEGNLFEKGPNLLHATVQLPREGIWIIYGFLQCEGWEKPIGYRDFFAVTGDAAADMSTREFKSGPLGYLDNFSYGKFWKRVPDEDDPVILELDISKVPSVGEEVLLTCHINSIIDLADYSVEFRFGKRGDDGWTTTITGDSLLVDGDLSWEGDLEKCKPVEFSATIKFPEAGDWLAKVVGDHPTSAGILLTDTIEMVITSERGYFGWEEWPLAPFSEQPEKEQPSQIPPPPL